jgi:hypothetical protein
MVRLTDRTLAITGELLRLVELSRIDYLEPKRTQIKVASRWEQFVELAFAAGSRPGVTPSVATNGPGVTPTPTGSGTTRWPLTMRAGPPLVLSGVPATLTEPDDAVTDRVWLSLRDVGALVLQGGSGRAAITGTQMQLMYSLTGAGGSFVALGPTMPLDVVRYPSIGDAGAVASGARSADRVCMTWGLEGGDGATVVEVSNIYVSPANAVAPPTAPEPPDDEPPSGPPLGNIIHDLNAFSLMDVLGDGDEVNTWPDDGPQGLDADVGFSLETTPPHFRPTGFPGGLPCVRFGEPFEGAYNGLGIPGQITNDSFTTYFVLSNLALGSGVPSGIAGFWDGGDGYPKGKGITVLGSGIVGGTGGMGAFVNTHISFPTFENVQDTWGMLDPHIYRFVYDRGASHWYLYVDGVLVADNECPGQFTESTFIWMNYNPSNPALDFCHVLWARELTYDKAHVGAGDTAVEQFLRTQWGL